jgi:hypothetical protein
MVFHPLSSLYFFVSDQLRTFAERLNKFRISFKIFDQAPKELAKTLRSGTAEPIGLPRHSIFDRIHIINAIDSVGVYFAFRLSSIFELSCLYPWVLL